MKKGLSIISILIIVLISLSLVFMAAYYLYNSYFAENYDVVEAFDVETTNLVIEGDIVDMGAPIVTETEILIPLEAIRKYIDPNIYWDEDEQKVTVTTEDKIIRMTSGELEAKINGQSLYLNLSSDIIDGIIYVPIRFLSDFYSIIINYIPENNLVTIDYKVRSYQIAEIIDSGAVIREGKSRRYPIVKSFKEDENNEELRVYETYDEWIKVRATDGTIGYIESIYVKVKWETNVLVPFMEIVEREFPFKPNKGKINLVWHGIYNGTPDMTGVELSSGLDVISPTWFEVENEQGDISSLADIRYTNWAHDNGVKVWALFKNDFTSRDNTSIVLKSSLVRDYMITQILAYATLYELDGINVDFENMNLTDKEAFVQFIRELSIWLHKDGIVLSVDTGVPDGSEYYSLCYDHERLAQSADYIAIMTYDQHWSSSPIAGAVAEYTWVEEKIKRVLEMVPNEKLLMGIPFYIRVWEEEVLEDGVVEVSSAAVITMDRAQEIAIEDAKIVVWDENSGQFYCDYNRDESYYRMWIEDKYSIDLKSSLIHKYDLAGGACWEMYFANQQVWDILERNLKEIQSYGVWNEITQHIQYDYYNLYGSVINE